MVAYTRQVYKLFDARGLEGFLSPKSRSFQDLWRSNRPGAHDDEIIRFCNMESTIRILSMEARVEAIFNSGSASASVKQVS